MGGQSWPHSCRPMTFKRDRPSFCRKALENCRSSSDNETQSKFLWEVHHYTNEYIRFADTKAAFIATACTALIGALIASKIFDSTFRMPPSQWLWSQRFSIVAVTLLGLAVILCVWAIRPRLPGKNPTGGFIFWESVVAHGSAQAFSQNAAKLQNDDRVAAISDHVYILASVAKRKYRWVSWAVWFGLPGGLVAGAVLFMQHAMS
jgi:hypothetical protein